MNSRINTSKSSTTNFNDLEKPPNYVSVITLCISFSKTGSEKPFQKIAEWINKRQDYKVADFGCSKTVSSLKLSILANFYILYRRHCYGL